MNYKLFLLLLLLPFSFHAQVKKVKAKIVNPGSLYSTYDFDADAGLLKPAIKLQGGTSILSDIIKYSNQSNWPAGMMTLDSRLESRETIMKYTVYKIVKTSDYCILVAPALENKHMATNMRPAQDIYFIMELQGAEFEGNIPAPVVEEETVDYSEDEDEGVRAYISNPGDLYSTFNLKGNESARELLIDSGILTEEDFSIMVARANEDGWPSGIATLDGRLALREKMKEYVAYYLLDFGADGEYTMIWIPQDENQHMPANMRPKDDQGMYFILKSEGVEIDY